MNIIRLSESFVYFQKYKYLSEKPLHTASRPMAETPAQVAFHGDHGNVRPAVGWRKGCRPGALPTDGLWLRCDGGGENLLHNPPGI